MSSILLSTRTGVVVPPPGQTTTPIVPGSALDPSNLTRRVALESLYSTARVVLDGSSGWWRMHGSTGLEMSPSEVITDFAPGVDGSVLRGVRVVERPVFIPIAHLLGSTQKIFPVLLEELRSIVDPTTGEFRIVAASEFGERELTVVYRGGLSGDDTDHFDTPWRTVGISAVAVDPHPRARADRDVSFSMANAGGSVSEGVFLARDSDAPGSAPWPRALAASLGGVIGSDMTVAVQSQVPVWPTVSLTGPLNSFQGSMDTGWNVTVPAGVPAGSTLTIVTDPRRRSIRMDGELAAGRVGRGSVLRPFRPGTNVLNVAAPGGGQGTRISISWRDGYRSLW